LGHPFGYPAAMPGGDKQRYFSRKLLIRAKMQRTNLTGIVNFIPRAGAEATQLNLETWTIEPAVQGTAERDRNATGEDGTSHSSLTGSYG
jgi:hypothetical protein